ncbi:MAG TPA: hypothetical protein VG454_15720 [Gemmatimonadales bacterium]|nr:hypothetical protein [Gemmatimonadales bacterium]
MTRQSMWKLSIPIAVLLFSAAAYADHDKDRVVTGTFTVNRFEARGGALFAIGMIRGSIAGTGSFVVGEVAAPVTIGAAGAASAQLAVRNPAVAQQQATCTPLHIDIGAVTVNVMGLTVSTQPISLDLSGDSSAPLGNLVCTIESTLNDVVGLVGLLNQLLGTLTGLVGGLTGGLGGVTGGLGL